MNINISQQVTENQHSSRSSGIKAGGYRYMGRHKKVWVTQLIILFLAMSIENRMITMIHKKSLLMMAKNNSDFKHQLFL